MHTQPLKNMEKNMINIVKLSFKNVLFLQYNLAHLKLMKLTKLILVNLLLSFKN